ncbi:MAG: DNA polymerase III subunit chi [Rickettsiales bacterium]|nr:DNA polymerase III subunit chi [Rickettsiales bacterium]
MEVSFYQCDEALAKSIAPLLLKILDENKKALIVTTSQMEVKEIDAALWSFGKNKFIPHITDSDKDFDFKRQPIIITDKEDNFNGADYIVLTKEVSSNFLRNFSRVFYFYDVLNVAVAKVLAGKYKNIASKIQSYGKKDGKWVKIDI